MKASITQTHPHIEPSTKEVSAHRVRFFFPSAQIFTFVENIAFVLSWCSVCQNSPLCNSIFEILDVDFVQILSIQERRLHGISSLSQVMNGVFSCTSCRDNRYCRVINSCANQCLKSEVVYLSWTLPNIFFVFLQNLLIQCAST